MVPSDKIKEIIKQVSEEEDLPESVIEDIYRSIFTITKKILQSDEMPSVKLEKFGVFKARRYKVDAVIKKMISNYRKGFVEKETFYRAFARFWRVRRRLQIEENDRKRKERYNPYKYGYRKQLEHEQRTNRNSTS